MRQPWLHQPPFALVVDVFGDRGTELLPRHRRGLFLDDPGPRADHLGQRPVRDALAVGQTASFVPIPLVTDPVDVLEELPEQPGFAAAGVAEHRDQPGAPRRRAVFRSGDQRLQFVVSPDEQRLQPDSATSTAGPRDDPQRHPGVDRLLATLDLMHARILIGDRRVAGPAGDVVDEHLSGRCDRLQARGGVDRVAHHHALARDADLDRRPAGQDACADPELGHAQLFAERRDRIGQGQRCPDRALGIILERHRCAPHGHHGVADELLDRPAVALDQRPATLEVPRQHLAYVVGIAMLRDRREANQVGEQDRDQATLRGVRRRRVVEPGQGGAALATEPLAAGVRSPTGRAPQLQLCPALGTELAPGPVLNAASAADHDTVIVRPTVPGEQGSGNPGSAASDGRERPRSCRPRTGDSWI